MVKNISDYRRVLKDRILEHAMREFAHRGIKSVKMDDIAQGLCISKRTMYEIYQNKECLLFEGIKRAKEKNEKEMEDIIAQSANVIELVIAIYRKRVEEFKDTCPQFYLDLEKYPSIINYLNQFHNKKHNAFMAFLERGVQEGYFLSDVNIELFAELFDAIIDNIVKRQLYLHYPIEQIFKSQLLVVFRGFCTVEGIKILDRCLERY